MQKARAIVLLLGLFWLFGRGVPVFAQEQEEPDNDDEIPIESDWDAYVTDLYSRGDQTFVISLGVAFPTVFLNNGSVVDHHIDPPVGGTMSLSYNYFLNANLFVGGEIGVKFFHTLGDNTVFLVPIGARTGVQFVAGRFEFPITGTVGVAPQRYLNNGYAGLFLKGMVSAFFRFNPEWSFGLNADWSWYPQRPRETTEKNMDANILGVTLSARYHL